LLRFLVKGRRPLRRYLNTWAMDGWQEVGADLYPAHFHPLMDAISGAIDPTRPEDTSRCFQAMSYLLKHVGKALVKVRPPSPPSEL
jgi:hypothetical protein